MFATNLGRRRYCRRNEWSFHCFLNLPNATQYNNLQCHGSLICFWWVSLWWWWRNISFDCGEIGAVLWLVCGDFNIGCGCFGIGGVCVHIEGDAHTHREWWRPQRRQWLPLPLFGLAGGHQTGMGWLWGSFFHFSSFPFFLFHPLFIFC